MIPLKLQLKNFLSYGPDNQTIDFSGYKLICLSGKNGHGKSALLDAITWAIWGQARKISGAAKADQGLLRLGQTQMMVALDFEFNEQIYRVRREYAQTYGKPYAALDFGLLDTNEQFISLTDKTISLTQEKIEKTLNLSFDSFTNSAFLRQGQTNEFSKKSPKDRKEILANILGLNHYEDIRKLAMEKTRQATSDKTHRMMLQDTIEKDLQKKPALSAQILSTEQKLADFVKHNDEFEKSKQELTTLHKKLIEDTNKLQLLAFQYDQFVAKEHEQTTLLRETFSFWRLIAKKQRTQIDLGVLEQQKQTLENEIKEHQQKLQKTLELKEKYLKQKEAAQGYAHKLQEEQATATNQKKIQIERILIEQQSNQTLQKELARRIQVGEQEKSQIIQTIDQTHKLLASNSKNIQTHQIIEKQFERRKEYYQKFIEQGRWLTTELESLEQKKLMAHDDEDPSCPLCEQNLSAARKRFLKNKFSETEQFFKHRLQRITKIVRNLKATLIEQHAVLESSKKIIEQGAQLQAKLEEYTKTQTKITTLLEELTKQQDEVAKHSSQQTITLEKEQQELARIVQQNAQALDQHEAYKAIMTELKAIENEVRQIMYNQGLAQQTSDALKKIEQQLAEHQNLVQETTLQEQRKKTVQELCSSLRKLRNEKKQCELEIKPFQNIATRDAALKEQETTLTNNQKNLVTQKEMALQEKSCLETEYATLTKLEKEHQEQQKVIRELSCTIDDYQVIATATGKDGIQALLIEDAIPEIEQEANYLLSKLTNNQAQVFFESLRDLKKGGTKETLDIKISDSVGIRPYEMFSGGEAFRIDFALRIAISKLLARRAGTSLQTLIIDEGFGSQDEEGLGLIMDALYKIQDDFAKIVIVSHLPSMKDQFPVHFVVEKGPNGSFVSVMEQD